MIADSVKKFLKWLVNAEQSPLKYKIVDYFVKVSGLPHAHILLWADGPSTQSNEGIGH